MCVCVCMHERGREAGGGEDTGKMSRNFCIVPFAPFSHCHVSLLVQ